MSKTAAEPNLKLVASIPQKHSKGARTPTCVYDAGYDPEKYYRMTKAQATEIIGPVTQSWQRYSFALPGEVSSQTRILRAAGLLRELGLVTLAQRRTEAGTEYLIRLH